MCTYFKTETDVAQNLIDFSLILTVRETFHRKDFKWKKIWVYKVNFGKKQLCKQNLREKMEATTSSYFATGDVFILCL